MEGAPEFDKDAILRRIKALMAKTTSAGATEAEAMLAAEKVTELLNTYQLSMSEISLKEGECMKDFIDTEVKAEQPVEWCMGALGYLCDLKVWRHANQGKWNGTLHYFFGYESDVIVAKYLYALISRAMVYSWQDHCEALRAEAGTVRTLSGDDAAETWLRNRKSTTAKRSFLLGMADRINKRLIEMKDEQRRRNQTTTGRDLVPIKGTRVAEEWDKLGMRLKQNRAKDTKIDAASYAHGQAAGDKVGLNPGIKNRGNTSGYLN